MNHFKNPVTPPPAKVLRQVSCLIEELRTKGIATRLDAPVRYGQPLIINRGAEEGGRLVVYYADGRGVSKVQYQGQENALMREAKAFLEELLPRFGGGSSLPPVFLSIW